MGVVFSKCTRQQDYSDEEVEFGAGYKGYIPKRTFRKEEQIRSNILEEIELINPDTNQPEVRVRRSLASKVTTISHHTSIGDIRHSARAGSSFFEENINFESGNTQRKTKKGRPTSYPTSYSSTVDEELRKGNYAYTISDKPRDDYKFEETAAIVHEPSVDYEFEENAAIYEPPVDYEFEAEVEIHAQKAVWQKPQMATSEHYTTEKGKYEKQFKVLAKTDFLPRYHYHHSLLGWFTKGLRLIQDFPEKNFKECTVIIGGKIDDQTLSILFGETGMDKSVLTDLRKGALNRDILVVYFLSNKAENIRDRFMDFDSHFSYDEGTLLFVMQYDSMVDERLKSVLIQAVSSTKFGLVNLVAQNRSEIISRMTCVLEKGISGHLEEIRRNLCELPLTQNVATSLLEVNAILRRLKQASFYPDALSEEEDKLKGERISDMLQSYGEKILYHGFDKDTLYIITTDVSVKDNIEIFFSKSEFTRMKYVVTVQETLDVSFLAKSGVSLHGAKFVYVDNGPQAFHQDRRFATTGSLLMANGSSMVVVTSRHALSNRENIYVLIDKRVVKLGQEMINIQPMQYLHDDITIVEIDPESVPTINEKCEKLLIDSSGLPTPSQISSRELKVGDIVHKRGAKTNLTTGVVKSVQVCKLGGFQIASPVVQICGRESEPFASEGDSGSLVFQHSLSPEENILDVLAMVQGKLKVPIPNAPVVCIPMSKGYEALRSNIPEIQSLQFYNV